MIILAIDTSSNLCATCIWDSNQTRCLASKSLEINRGHAEHLLPLIKDVLAQAKLELSDIDKIVTGVGPGSFTGIRVGVSVARGFGVALDLPVVGVTSFQAISAEALRAGVVDQTHAVALTGGRGQAFAQFFNADGTPDSAPFIVELDSPDKSTDVRTGSKIFGNAAHLIDRARSVDGHDKATAAIETYAMLGAASREPAKPLYVRTADAKVQQGFALPRKEKNPV